MNESHKQTADIYAV